MSAASKACQQLVSDAAQPERYYICMYMDVWMYMNTYIYMNIMCVCVCLCVCERERERESTVYTFMHTISLKLPAYSILQHADADICILVASSSYLQTSSLKLPAYMHTSSLKLPACCILALTTSPSAAASPQAEGRLVASSYLHICILVASSYLRAPSFSMLMRIYAY
jgi:hypothetical protein